VTKLEVESWTASDDAGHGDGDGDRGWYRSAGEEEDVRDQG
jgi:hypothetical protein